MSDGELAAAFQQAARYAVAGEQDRSPVIALQHFSYARNTLESLLAVTTRKRLQRVTGEDVDRWLTWARRGQHAAQRILEQRFPLARPR